MPARMIPLLSALLLAGCASQAPLVATRTPQPLAGRVFRISSAGADPAAVPRVEQLVADGLRARGLRAVTAGEAPDYLVQVAYADRPPQVGVFTPAAVGEPGWLVHGQPRRPWSFWTRGGYALDLRIVEAASGRETYDAEVSRPYHKPGPGDLPALVAAALGPLKTQ